MTRIIAFFSGPAPKQSRRRLACLCVLFAASVAARTTAAADRSAGAARPNFLIIITDDQRFDSMDFMPKTKQRVFDEGLAFTHAYVTTPLCTPSRASMLTGMYAHHHGVQVNEDPLVRETFVPRLHDHGYYTGFVGKYLNSWEGTPRPEFDYWAARKRGHSTYFDPQLNVNGVWQTAPGYVTQVLRDYALKFLESALQRRQPFLLILSHNAPHAPVDPAPEDTLLYLDLPPLRPPSFNEADVSDKPKWIQARPPLTPGMMRSIDNHRRRQMQCLHSVDQANDSLLTVLANMEMLDNTVVIFLSDNGYHSGEHRLTSKWFVYEEAIRVPFAVRYPRLIPAPRTEPRLVANIDIAPTLYELAGLPIPPEVDGLSLVSLINGERVWREDLLIEGWPEQRGGPRYAAIHTRNHVYIESQDDRPEFYDMLDDPFQLDSQIHAPNYTTIIHKLAQRLHEFRPDIETSITDGGQYPPANFELRQNYPNPFHPVTTIRFTLTRPEHVILKIFDVYGRELATLQNGDLPAGEHSFPFEAGNMASGTYFCRLSTSTLTQTLPMQILK